MGTIGYLQGEQPSFTMRSFKNSLSLLLFLFVYLSGFSQTEHIDSGNYRFKRFMQEDGLVNDRIFTLFQDQDGFIWIGTRDGLNRFDGYHFKTFVHDPSDSTSISNNIIRSIVEDELGNLWIATAGGGLNYYDKLRGRFQHFRHDPKDSLSISTDLLAQVYIDKSNVLWIGTERGGINRMKDKGKFERLLYYPKKRDHRSYQVFFEDSAGGFWVGANFGLYKFNKITNQFERTRKPKDVPFLSVLAINEDSAGHLLLGTWSGGLYRMDINSGEFEYISLKLRNEKEEKKIDVPIIFKDKQNEYWIGVAGRGLFFLDGELNVINKYQNKTYDPFTISNNSPYSILQDRTGNLWIGNMGGLNYLDFFFNQFTYIRNDPVNENSLSNNRVITFFEEDQNNIWIGTAEGLNKFNQQKKSFERYYYDPNSPNSLSSNFIIDLNGKTEDNSLWVATKNKGLNKVNLTKNKILPNPFLPESSRNKQFPTYSSIIKDSKGNLWIGCQGGGLIQKDFESGQTIKTYRANRNDSESLNSDIVFSLLEDNSGHIWVGTQEGLSLLNPQTGKFKQFKNNPLDTTSISDNVIRVIYNDHSNNLWVGTYNGGLNLFDRNMQSFKAYKKKDGLPSNRVLGIQEDELGRLWLSTNNGISRFDIDKAEFKNFDVSDGLQGNQFSANASYTSPYSGAFYFGGTNGFNLFFPDRINENEIVPPIVFTKFTRFLSGKEKNEVVIDENITYKKQLTLSYKDDIIEFEFAALNYVQPHKNKYKYRLKGFKEEWVDLGNKRSVTFTDLPAATYTLEVKGSNNDGKWNEHPVFIDIIITPPWWATWWAYTIYAILLISLIYFLHKFQLSRKLERAEAEKIKEIDQLKTRLYTNITHEFRTPLTVILGMVEQIKEQPKNWLKEGLTMIYRNGNYLLNLVNQMLDLQKLESGHVTLQLVQGDVLPYLRYITESFHSYAESRGLELHFLANDEQINMDYDKEKLLNIVSNLLSNAVKYNLEGGNIYLQVEQIKNEEREQLRLKVRDTGIGISKDRLPQIFNRFYQIGSNGAGKNEGTGIGLAIVDELIKLLNGHIDVKSTLGKGTEFTIWLPVSRNAPIEQEFSVNQVISKAKSFLPTNIQRLEQANLVPKESDQMLVLIAEDNADVVRYLQACLEDNYQVLIAINGKDGLEKAIKTIPDIVISDVMMPEMDGFQLCDALKGDERTSHIPIILLTAKADSESRIAGLKRGADAYLSKPFNKEELLVRLEKLIELRRILRERYENVIPEKSKNQVFEIEDAFLKKVRSIIEDNIENEDFDVMYLSRALTMSRTQVYRKIKALTDRSIVSYILFIRLNLAKKLLETTTKTVTEVAFEVGFKDLSHFSRSYSTEFGYPPSATYK